VTKEKKYFPNRPQQSDIKELEMKTPALEGSLSAAINEVSNLRAENEALFRSNEKIEETVRGYIHKCQDLEMLNDELVAAKEDLSQTCAVLEGKVNQAELAFEEKTCQLAELKAAIEEKDEAVEKLKGLNFCDRRLND